MPDSAAIMPEVLTATRWEIVPKGWFSNHYHLVRDGEIVTTLRMSMWSEACEFDIAGHQFAVQRRSLWKDGFQVTADGEPVCSVKRTFWSRRFEITAADQTWWLAPTGFFSRAYQLLIGELEVGTIKPAGWFTRRRLAEFSDDVPPPIQIIAIFLVLIIYRREESNATAGS